MTDSQVIQRFERLFQSSAAVTWVDLDDVGAGTALGCIDGRQAGCVLGAPGGSLGELVLVLSTLEWSIGQSLAEDDLRGLCDAGLDALGAIDHHTDDAALRRLKASMDGWGALSDDALEFRLRGPTDAERTALREALGRVSEAGCGHFAAMSLAPTAYRTRADLVRAVVAWFYDRLWAGDARARLAVLRGAHKECALVTVNGPLGGEPKVPVPAPCQADPELRAFVHHVPALRRVRGKLVRAMVLRAKELGYVRADEQEMLLEAERLGERHLSRTMRRLAPHAPRIRLQFGRDGLSVEGAD